jgi:hypothetical protein
MQTEKEPHPAGHGSIRQSGNESLVGIVPPGGAADTQLCIRFERPRATREPPCPYCELPIRLGGRIDKTYVRIGGSKAWADGRGGYWWVHSHCARGADDRRRREPPLEGAEWDEIKAQALQRWHRGPQRWLDGHARPYIPFDALPAFEAAAERIARRCRKVRDERRRRSPGVR